MLVAVAVLSTLAFLTWLVLRALRGKEQLKAHDITYGLAIITGVYTLAFFLSMDIPPLIKIVVSMIIGVALIFVAAYVQRRRQPGKPPDS